MVDIHVSVSTTGSTGMAEDVRHGRLDLALLGLPDQDLIGLRTRQVATWPFIALVPDGHPLADRPEVKLSDLTGLPFVDTSVGFGNRLMADRAFDAAGSPRRVGVEVANMTAVPAYVRNGLGIAVVPDVGLGPAPGTARLKITDMTAPWPLTIATLAGRPPSSALRALLDLIDT